jgi:hypothetical protein
MGERNPDGNLHAAIYRLQDYVTNFYEFKRNKMVKFYFAGIKCKENFKNAMENGNKPSKRWRRVVEYIFVLVLFRRQRFLIRKRLYARKRVLTKCVPIYSSTSNFNTPHRVSNASRTHASNGGKIVENELLVLLQNAPESRRRLGENINKQVPNLSDE